MSNYLHTALIYTNVALWNWWLGRFNSRADLRGANFRECNLGNINLRKALLHGANFYRAKLYKANFCKAVLHSVDLREASLREANFQDAVLYKADLRKAILNEVNFRGANLSEFGLSKDDRRLMLKTSDNLALRTIFRSSDQSDLRKANVREFANREASLLRQPLNETNFSQASLYKSNFYKSNLYKVVFDGADLTEANFGQSNLHRASVCDADLSRAILNEADLRAAKLIGADISQASLKKADLNKCNLSGALLSESDLSEANLNRANLDGAILRRANFKGSNLSAIQALGTSFESAILTGACIQDWNINASTNLQNIVCEYIYLGYDSEKQEYNERRPHDPDKIFADGDFIKLVQKARSTVDLIFRNGIDWQAFAHSIQQLQVRSGTTELRIQSIESKNNGNFVIRVNTPPGLNKTEVQRFVERKYKESLQAVENQYRYQLQAKDDQIALYREQSTNLWEIAKLAAKQSPVHLEGTFVLGDHYNMENAKFGGGFAAEGGTQVGGTLNDSSISVGRDVVGSTFQTGNQNTASLQFQQAQLPQPKEVDIRTELDTLCELLGLLGSADQRKIKNALEDASEELKKTNPDKDEVGRALERAMSYAQKTEGFASSIDKLRPHIEKAAAWLGKNWYKLLSVVGLTI